MDIVVFDTVVYLRAMLDPASYCGRIVFEHSAAYTLAVSTPVAREVVDVLHRPALMRRFSTLPGRNLEAILNVLSNADFVDIDEFSFPRVCRDPKDDKFLATAVAAGATFLVSEDKDLLVLGSYRGTEVVDAATFLSSISRRDQ